jgi:hypothetical protein
MPNEASTLQLTFNGINGASGDYLLPAASPAQISKIIRGEKPDKTHAVELKRWYERITQTTMGPKEGVDPKKIEESGWGIIFAAQDAEQVPAIKGR